MLPQDHRPFQQPLEAASVKTGQKRLLMATPSMHQNVLEELLIEIHAPSKSSLCPWTCLSTFPGSELRDHAYFLLFVMNGLNILVQ